MRKIEVVKPDRSSMEPTAPRESMRGPTGAPHRRLACVGRSWLVSPPDAPIWMRTADLEAGTTIAWDRDHGDEALFVLQGELAVDGRVCPSGGALVIEAQGCARVETVVASRVLHMGARDDRDGSKSERSTDGDQSKVHVIGPRGTFEAIEPGRETRFFADATCPGCRVWLLYTARSFAYESPVHSHSQDELIHVLAGEIRIGSLRAGPGASVFIAADQPYQFRSGAEGFAFLNYRRDASQMTIRTTGEKIVETAAANRMTPVSGLDSSGSSRDTSGIWHAGG